MKIIAKAIAASVFASFLAAPSCSQDNTLQYGVSAIGTITADRFTSDAGTVFHIEEDLSGKYLEDDSRAFIIYDVLNKNTDSGYGIRIREGYHVTVKAPVNASSESEDMQAEDPVNVTGIWISGGYVNMHVLFPMIIGSSVRHSINLILEDNPDTWQGYSFSIRHNAFGETMSGTDSGKFILGGGFMSFPISDMIREDEAAVRFSWKWYKSAGDSGITSETEENIVEGIFRKSRFGHAPVSPSDFTCCEMY